MHWRWYHKAFVAAWAGLTIAGQALAGGPGGPVATAGVVAGATVGALLVVWIFGSLAQWTARQIRGTDRSSR